MSAFIVSDAHINALVNFAVSKKASYYFEGIKQRADISKDNAKEIGQILLNENYRSINARYRGEEGKPHKLKYVAKLDPAIKPVDILKLISCLDYQSCETDDWKQSHAFAILEGIKDAAIYALPGYEAAPWGIR